MDGNTVALLWLVMVAVAVIYSKSVKPPRV